MKVKKTIGLLVSLLVCYGVSAIGALASIQAQSFYGQLAQPVWAPPPWLFGPVWTVLYGLMALAVWIIWLNPPSPERKKALILFAIQLVLNGLWSWLFFTWRLGLVAFIEIVLLGVCILLTFLAFKKIKPLAAGLLFPYLLWVSFATCLNFSLWQRNPSILG